MEPPSTDNAPAANRSSSLAICELNRGCQVAVQLYDLLQDPTAGVSCADSAAAGELLTRIIQSLADAISVLTTREGRRILQRQQPEPAVASAGSSGKDQLPAKDRRSRGCKRRRPSATWTKVSATPLVDEYGWRKYGQKEILNAKFPRSYFRCTHRNDQGCQATKQVQRLEDDPANYQTTYIGHHTCRDPSRARELIVAEIGSEEPFSFSFEPDFAWKNKFPAPSFLRTEKEDNEEVLEGYFLPVDSSESSGSPDRRLLPDFSMFESCVPVTELPEILPAQGDGFSRSSSGSDGLELGLKLDGDFGHLFYF